MWKTLVQSRQAPRVKYFKLFIWEGENVHLEWRIKISFSLTDFYLWFDGGHVDGTLKEVSPPTYIRYCLYWGMINWFFFKTEFNTTLTKLRYIIQRSRSCIKLDVQLNMSFFFTKWPRRFRLSRRFLSYQIHIHHWASLLIICSGKAMISWRYLTHKRNLEVNRKIRMLNNIPELQQNQFL